MVHVNTHKIKENNKHNLQQPVITVKKRCDPSLISLSTLDAATVATLGNGESVARKSQNVNLYGHEVEILGGCRVVYRPNNSKCGAKVWYFDYAQYQHRAESRCWIETLNEVKVICWD